MKRIKLLLATALISASSMASTVIWNGDGEEAGVTPAGWWDRCSPITVNEDGNTVLKFTTYKEGQPSEANEWERNNIARGGVPALTNKRISFRIKKATSGNVRMTLEFNGTPEQTLASWYDGNGEWKKMIFDYNSVAAAGDAPTALRIYSHIEGSETIDSEDVYVDDVVIEDAASISGTNQLTLSGDWAKGSCANVSDGWAAVPYDDFATVTFNSAVTSMDMTSATIDGYDDQVQAFVASLASVNPNALVYGAKTYGIAQNIIVNGVAEKLVLTSGYNFNVPTAFTCSDMNLNYNVNNGEWLAVTVPFEVSSFKIGETGISSDNYKICNYINVTGDKINTTAADIISANVPTIFNINEIEDNSIITFVGEGVQTIDATASSYGEEFIGAYSNASVAAGYYMALTSPSFNKLTAESNLDSFKAYISLENANDVLVIDAGIPTGVESVENGSDNKAFAANGNVYVVSDKAKTIAIYDTIGKLVRVVNITEGTNTISGLTNGAYIVEGTQVIL